MATVTDHYAQHLAPVYLWMAGGFDEALARGERELEAVCEAPAGGRTAVDLGAGFGQHAIPLARRGWPVVAIDSSPLLLDLLRGRAATLPVRTVVDDLLAFPRHLDAAPGLILCMGDTLTHLPEARDVERLLDQVAGALVDGGRFVASFRDYTTPLAGEARFIPVRSDADRVLTCFLEYGPDHVTVHDLLHERSGAGWRQRVSAYRKLRLAPAWVVAALQARGLEARVEPGLAGMVRVVADRRR